ncbi:MAG TPA: serine/threonine-protein kinase, partial [Candidatus Nitrosotenuis sp.]|nr:serine/threonine-protein kinase [Candidatus Nitrosotenuis sp.]
MIGQTIAHYRVTEKLGAGGMGEVYRAHDTKLNRDVALKVLPPAFVQDAQRMGRFQREAQVLASLNHPHIAAIYGLEESGTGFQPVQDAQARVPVPLRALVMELVEGTTLADRVATGALPLDEALPLARQIADALEYAHERGVVHRDLKPANIKVTPAGQVKVLDFGLAKAMAEETSGGDVSGSPTLSLGATKAGLILGTAAYMSPEQAKGKSVDRRADIWAFGVVLFEMLSGQQLYSGETVSETLARVIEREPDLSALPARTPQKIRALLRRCLTKDPRQRLQSVGEARIAIEEAIAQPEEKTEETAAGGTSAVQQKSVLPWAAAVVMTVVALALGGLVFLRPRPAAPPVARFTIHLSEVAKDFSLTVSDNLPIAISPDGRKIAFGARDDKGYQV